MADVLDGIVSVSIDAQTNAPTAPGFGIPLLVGFHTKFAERVRYYTSLNAMLSDGFLTTEALYRMATAAFSQNPRPERVGIGRLTVGSTMVVVLTPIAQNSHSYSVTINGTVHTFVSDANATAAEIVTGLSALINAGAQAAKVTASGTVTLIITSDVVGEVFSLEHLYADFDQQNTTTDGSGIAAQIAAIQLEDDAWYSFSMDSFGKAEILAAAAFIETQKKFGWFVTGDSDVIAAGSGDVASALKTLNYEGSSLWFSRKPHQYLNVGISAVVGAMDPGEYTVKFKEVNGVGTDSYSTTQLGRLQDKRANYYISVNDQPMTGEGQCPSGEFIDIPIFIDWQTADMQIAIFTLFVNNKKVPLTNIGGAQIESEIRGSLKRGISAGGLSGDDLDAIIVTVPKAKDLSTADRAARRWTGITFSAPLAGAVHSVVIQGAVTV